MKDYAIFVSLTDNYAYLFNTLYNSAEFFGIGEYADFVIIYNDLPESYIKFMTEKTQDRKMKINFVKFNNCPEDSNLSKVMSIKFYRYKLMAELGKDYKSILFLDTDIFFVSDIKEYFEIAHKTNLIVATNDQAIRHYKTDFEKGCCPAYSETKKPLFDHEVFDGKFICNVPTFIDANKYSYVLEEVFNHRKKLGQDNSWPFTGDLDTMNLIFTKYNLKENMVILSAHLWTGVHFSIYRSNICVRRWMPSEKVKLTDKSYNNKFLFMSENHEHIRSFHGRDWYSEKSELSLKSVSIPKLLGQMEGDFSGNIYERALKKREGIFDLIQSCALYFQFESYISLDDLNSVLPVGCDKYDYMKEKQKKLEKVISTFKE